ncbi:MAG: TolC family protein [Cytophagales bacterium]|nr:TolC family protein [Cytophagales bacterium]
MKRISRFILLLALLLPFSRVLAQQAEPLSLEECLKVAIEKNHEVAKAHLEIEKSKQQIKEVRSTGLPQLKATGTVTDHLRIPVVLIDGTVFGKEGTVALEMGKKYNGKADVEATQLLYNHEFWIGLKAAKKAKELYQLAETKTTEDVIYQVASAYYQWLQLKGQASALEDNIGKIKKIIKVHESLTAAGLAHKLDEKRLRVNLSNMNVALSQLQTGKATQLNLIKLYMGLTVDSPLALKENSQLAAEPLQTLNPTQSFMQRSDLQMLAKQTELIGLEKKSIVAQYYPTLVAVGSLSSQAMRDEFDIYENKKWHASSYVGVQLQIPIFDGLKKQAKIKQSKIHLEQLKHDFAYASEAARIEAQNARYELSNAYKNVNLQKENLELAEDVYGQTVSQYKAQIANITDLLNAEMSLRESQNSYFMQELAFQEARLKLLKAEGNLLSLLNSKN